MADWPYQNPPDKPEFSGLPLARATAQKTWNKKLRQFALLRAVEKHPSLKDALNEADVPLNTYRQWRIRDPEFAWAMDQVRQAHPEQMQHVGKAAVQAAAMAKRDEFKEGQKLTFAQFRKRWFKTDTPDFQQQIVDAYESTELGKITMILIPPEHGKTTLFEDYAAWKLATDPTYRFTIGSESQSMSRKILKRVQNRLDPEGPFPAFVTAFGPFVPQTVSNTKRSRGDDVAGRKTRQPWGQDYFSVYKKGSDDERDYSMVALGIGSQIAGTRTDHLHIDDVMSLNNLSQAEAILQTIRQDWLTRPGQRGRTTINGTRVGVKDVYELFEDELDEELLTIIKMPAIVTVFPVGSTKPVQRPLWPYDEKTGWGWTDEMLSRQRRLVGESAWERNYMQKPMASGDQTFSQETLDKCDNPLRSAVHKPDAENGALAIGLDPSIGGLNCTSVTQFGSDAFRLFESREDYGLSSNAEIAAVIESLILKWTNPGDGTYVAEIVIEDAVFQKGLLQDDAFIALRNKYGCTIRGHQTGGMAKYDANYGVASMVHHMELGHVEFPAADDPTTKKMMNEVKREFMAWRPYKSGKRLKQDRVMAIWFCYKLWAQRFRSNSVESSQNASPWTGDGLGYDRTDVRVLSEGPYAA